VDGVQLVTVMSNAWSASSISSREGEEGRLERKEASGVAGVLDLLCNRTITMNQKVRHRERREMVQARGRRVLHCTGIRRRFACSSEDSGERFGRPGGAISREGRGEARGGGDHLIGAVRDRNGQGGLRN
jgi:hypothetical protein